MISTILLSILNGFLGFLIGLLPVGNIPTQISTALTYFVGVLNTFNFLLPIDTLFVVLGLAITFEFVVFLWHIIQWIIRKIPFIN